MAACARHPDFPGERDRPLTNSQEPELAGADLSVIKSDSPVLDVDVYLAVAFPDLDACLLALAVPADVRERFLDDAVDRGGQFHVWTRAYRTVNQFDFQAIPEVGRNASHDLCDALRRL